jgi:ABC-2 type transport system permease protein
MSTQSNAVSEMNVATQTAVPVMISPFRRYYWSVRREVWEHRGVFIAPTAVAGFVIVAVIIAAFRGVLGFSADMVVNVNGVERHPTMNMAFNPAMTAIMGVAFLASIFYCLSALHNERRDRSVLFWKSLPVSDTTTVMAKTTIPLVALPIFTMALVVVTHIVILLIVAVAQLVGGRSGAAVWEGGGLPQMWGTTFYHMVTIHVLWYAPIYAYYLMMVSAWAKRAPILWAVLPPVAAGIVEKIAFNSDHVFSLLRDRFNGDPANAMTNTKGMMFGAMTQLTPLQFLASPGLWIGLAVAVVFLFAAVRLRRWQGII